MRVEEKDRHRQKIETGQVTMGTTGRESESLREPERKENAEMGWVLGAGGQIGKNKETIQCSKH